MLVESAANSISILLFYQFQFCPNSMSAAPVYDNRKPSSRCDTYSHDARKLPFHRICEENDQDQHCAECTAQILRSADLDRVVLGYTWSFTFELRKNKTILGPNRRDLLLGA